MKLKKNRCKLWVYFIIAMCITSVLSACSQNRPYPKCEWGMTPDVLDESNILSINELESGVSYEYRDISHEIDGFDKVKNKNNSVVYYFNENNELYWIKYYLDFSETGKKGSDGFELLTRQFGNDYYMDDNMTAWWWMEDTIVQFATGNRISYFDAEWFLNESGIEHVIEHFK